MGDIYLKNALTILLAIGLGCTAGCNDKTEGNGEPNVQEDRARVILSGDISDTVQSVTNPEFNDSSGIQFVDEQGNQAGDSREGFNLTWEDSDESTVWIAVADADHQGMADTGSYLPLITDTVDQICQVTVTPNGLGNPDLVSTIPDNKGSIILEVNNDKQVKGTINNIKLQTRDTNSTCIINGTFRINR